MRQHRIKSNQVIQYYVFHIHRRSIPKNWTRFQGSWFRVASYWCWNCCERSPHTVECPCPLSSLTYWLPKKMFSPKAQEIALRISCCCRSQRSIESNGIHSWRPPTSNPHMEPRDQIKCVSELDKSRWNQGPEMSSWHQFCLCHRKWCMSVLCCYSLRYLDWI